jgi:hypothetical protein
VSAANPSLLRDADRWGSLSLTASLRASQPTSWPACENASLLALIAR